MGTTQPDAAVLSHGLAGGRSVAEEEHAGAVSRRWPHEDVGGAAVLAELFRPFDLAVACAGLQVAMVLAGAAQSGGPSAWVPVLSPGSALLLAGFLVFWHVAFAAMELYELRRLRSPAEEARRVCAGTLAGTLILLVYLALRPDGAAEGEVAVAAVFWLVTFGATLGGRRGLRSAAAVWRAGRPRRVVVVGSGAGALRAMDVVARGGSRDVVALIDGGDSTGASTAAGHAIASELESVLMREVVDEVVVALPLQSQYAAIGETIRTCARMGIDVRLPSDVFAWRRGDIVHDPAGGLDGLTLRVVPVDYRRRLRRPVELLATLLLILLLAPVLLLVACIIRLHDGGPVFFVQRRHGLNRRVFPMLKFRTMVPGAEAMQSALEMHNEACGAVFKIRSDPRVTRVGAFLRRTSLDELPQLFNVVAGHMSLVGPRPLPLRDVSRFEEPGAMRRFSVMPGITGLWQVSGRSDLGFEEMISLDLRYIDEWSPVLDMRILLKTFGAVVRGDGAV